MAHELRKMTIDSHVTLPFDVTMTLVLIDDLYDDTSALRPHIKCAAGQRSLLKTLSEHKTIYQGTGV